MVISDYLGRRALYTPERPAVIDTGKDPELRLSYREMNDRANRVACWLRERAGIGRRDRVAILARDGVEHLDLFCACAKLGAIHAPLNTRLHWRELQGLLERTAPKVLFYMEGLRGAVAELRASLGRAGMPMLVHLDGPGLVDSQPYEHMLGGPAVAPASTEDLDPEDIAAIVFTGGTSGIPKAARISHRMVAWNTLNTVIHDLRHEDVYLNVFPLFHTGGLFVYTVPQLILGGTTVLVPQFEPKRVLELIERERVTVFAGVPTMYQMLTEAPNWASAGLSSLRFCTSGGAPLPVPLVEHYTRGKGIRFKQGFGMSEFGPGVFALAPEDARRKAGSIGRPNFFVEARIVDHEGCELGPDEVGELLLKGPSSCSGYFGDGEASAALLDGKGWFHTGDLARCDQEGYYYIVDRKKDMFVSGGENVYPVEIEAVLYRHPAVQLCAVVGVPDPRWGEVGRACVVLKPGAAATEAEIIEHLGRHLARYKVPGGVEFMAALPLSATGKVLKRELQRELAGVP